MEETGHAALQLTMVLLYSLHPPPGVPSYWERKICSLHLLAPNVAANSLSSAAADQRR